jgi:hypothetical protein
MVAVGIGEQGKAAELVVDSVQQLGVDTLRSLLG